MAVGLLGLILGGGIVALADRDGRGGPGPHRFGDDRGHSRFDDRGPNHFPDRGPEGRWDR